MATGSPASPASEAINIADIEAATRPDETGFVVANGKMLSETGEIAREIFEVLSDEIRLKILSLLFGGSRMNVKDLCERVGMSQPAVSHHLALLKRAGILNSEKGGKSVFYGIAPSASERMEPVIEGLQRIFALKESPEEK